MRQAIVTKYFGASNSFGARIRATCASGRCTTMWDYEKNTEDNHQIACFQLQLKMANFNPSDVWMEKMIGGALPNNDGYAFVFVGKAK